MATNVTSTGIKNGNSLDENLTLNIDGSSTFAGKVTSASTQATDPGTTVVTKDYLEGNSGGSGGEGFVEVVGDNMTGPLTIGPEGGTALITLDATDGSATFAGVVQAIATSSFHEFSHTGTPSDGWCLRVGGAGNDYALFRSNGEINLGSGNDSFNSSKVQIKADGSGVFVGGLESRLGMLADQRITAGNTLDVNSTTVGLSVGSANGALLYTDGSATFAGSVDVAGLDVEGAQTSNIVAVAALDIDCGLGNYFTKTISGTSTFTFSNAPSGKSFAFTLEVTHTGGTITWPSAVKWPADTAPTLTTGTTHLFVFVTDDGGSRWRGAAIADYVN